MRWVLNGETALEREREKKEMHAKKEKMQDPRDKSLDTTYNLPLGNANRNQKKIFCSKAHRLNYIEGKKKQRKIFQI